MEVRRRVLTPIDGVRFRGVASLDVREANLADRYAGVFQAQSSFQDPNHNVASTTARSVGFGQSEPHAGNRQDLQRRHGASAELPAGLQRVDRLLSSRASATRSSSLTIQQIVNLCFAGNQTSCALITRNPGRGQPVRYRQQASEPGFGEHAGAGLRNQLRLPTGRPVLGHGWCGEHPWFGHALYRPTRSIRASLARL